jgi:hypothetical protein
VQALLESPERGVSVEVSDDPAVFQDQLQALGARSAGAQSAILDLAFAIANQRESGRLTDQDITRALITLGANQSDPRIFQATLKRVQNRLINEERFLRQGVLELNPDPASFSAIRAMRDLVAGGGVAPADGGDGGGAESMSTEALKALIGAP